MVDVSCGGGGYSWAKGTKVEVSRNEEGGSTGAWYEATIVEPPWKSSAFKKTSKALIQYKTLVTDDTESVDWLKPLTEYVHERFIRPVPSYETRECFVVNDDVDAFYQNGWWTGVITQVLENSRYAVSFQNPPDTIEFDCCALRLHLDWINGEWVRPANEVLTAAKYPEQLGHSCNTTNNHMKAIQFESSGSGTATDKTEERTLSSTNSGKNQIEHTAPCNKISSCAGFSTCKKLKQATPSSDDTISRPLKRPKGDTTEYNGGEKTETTQQEVGVGNQTVDSVKKKGGPPYLHIQSSPTSVAEMEIMAGGDHDQQKAGKECVMKEDKMSAVLGINKKTNESQCKNAYKLLSEIDHKKECGITSQKRRRGRPRKLPVVSETSTVTAADVVGKACTSDEVNTTTYTNSTGSQDASIGHIAGVSETDCRVEKTKMAITKISFDVTSDHQPLHICLEGFSSGDTVNQLNEARESQVELDCSDNNMLHLNQKLPFVKRSPIWEVIESMEVFQTMHQNPHFHPLYNLKEECREGSAVGIMVTFANLVEKMRKLQLDDPRSLWDNYLEVLLDLEMHGFDVQLLRGRLNELLGIRERHEQILEELKERESELLEDVNKNSKIDEEIAKLNKKIDKLNKKVREFEEKRASAMSIKKIQDSEIATLQLRADDIRESIQSAQLDFGRASAAPW